MIYCLKHPSYRGHIPPVLACKTCCHIFISEVKRCRDAGEPLPSFVSQPREAYLKVRKQTLLERNLKQQTSDGLTDKSLCQFPRY